MNLHDLILDVMVQVASQSGKELVDDLSDETLLLESGLDSLDFAILVAKLEEELQDDPFTAMEEPVYPKTLGDFVAIYERHLSAS